MLAVTVAQLGQAAAVPGGDTGGLLAPGEDYNPGGLLPPFGDPAGSCCRIKCAAETASTWPPAQACSFTTTLVSLWQPQQDGAGAPSILMLEACAPGLLMHPAGVSSSTHQSQLQALQARITGGLTLLLDASSS